MRRLVSGAFVFGIVLASAFGCGETTKCLADTCGGTCTDRDLDPKNCGKCGNVCASGQCASGGCVVAASLDPVPEILGVVGNEFIGTEYVTAEGGTGINAVDRTTGAERRLAYAFPSTRWILSGHSVYFVSGGSPKGLKRLSVDATPAIPTSPETTTVAPPVSDANYLQLVGGTDTEVFAVSQSNASTALYALDTTAGTWTKTLELKDFDTPSWPSRVLATKTDPWFSHGQKDTDHGIRHCTRGATCTPEDVTTNFVQALTLSGESLTWLEGVGHVDVLRVTPDTIKSPETLGSFDTPLVENTGGGVLIVGQYNRVEYGAFRLAADATGAYALVADIVDGKETYHTLWHARGGKASPLTVEGLSACGLAVDATGLYYCAVTPSGSDPVLVVRAP